MAVIATVPQTTLPAGPVTIGPGAVAAAAKQYIMTVVMIGWPNAGDKAFDYVCDVSLDGGATWIAHPPSSGDVWDIAVPALRGQPANQFKITCDIPDQGNANRRIRLTAILTKPLTISGTLEAF